MCLSTVYENIISDDSVLMNNVSNLKIDKDKITLVDLMERKKTVIGCIDKVDLIDNYIIINTKVGNCE